MPPAQQIARCHFSRLAYPLPGVGGSPTFASLPGKNVEDQRVRLVSGEPAFTRIPFAVRVSIQRVFLHDGPGPASERWDRSQWMIAEAEENQIDVLKARHRCTGGLLSTLYSHYWLV